MEKFIFCVAAAFVVSSCFSQSLVTFHKLLAPFSSFLAKGAFTGLRQFLTTGGPLKMMKNVFCLTSKALFVEVFQLFF